jgi:hypothetical protein
LTSLEPLSAELTTRATPEQLCRARLFRNDL